MVDERGRATGEAEGAACGALAYHQRHGSLTSPEGVRTHRPCSSTRLANNSGHSGAAELHAPRMPSARARSTSAGILREDPVPRAAARSGRRRLAVRRRRHRHGDRHDAVQPRPAGPPWPPPPRAMTRDSRSPPLAANAMRDSAFPAVTVMMPVRDEAMSDIREALCSIAAQDYPGTIETVIADGSRRPLDRRLAAAAGVREVRNTARTTSAGLQREREDGFVHPCGGGRDGSSAARGPWRRPHHRSEARARPFARGARPGACSPGRCARDGTQSHGGAALVSRG